MNARNRERFVKLLTCTVSQLCKSGFFDSKLHVNRIDGLLGITLSSGEVFLVNISESFSSYDDCGRPESQDACKTADKPFQNVTGSGKGSTGLKQSAVCSSTLSTSELMHERSAEQIDTTNSVRLDMLNSSGLAQDNVAENQYIDVPQDSGFTRTFIKLEENSDDCILIPDNFNSEHYQDKKHPLCMLNQQLLEGTEEHGAPCGPMQLPNNEGNYIMDDSYFSPNSADYSQISHDFYQVACNGLSFDQCNQQTANSEAVIDQNDAQMVAPGGRLFPVLQPKHSSSQSHRRENFKTIKWRHDYDAATLRECVELVRTYKMSQREASRVFRIPRTTIQLNLARMYPTWVSSSRRIFMRKPAYWKTASHAVSNNCMIKSEADVNNVEQLLDTTKIQ